MALMLWPISELPPLAAALTWFYIKVALTLMALYWTFRMVETPAAPFPPWSKALAVALSLRMILSDLSHGNVNLLILFLMVGSLYAFRCGRDHLCGNILALAIACKLTPALFVGYFVWKRSWNVLIGCAVGLVLYFLVVPSLFLGFARNWELLTSWVEVMVMPFVRDGFVTSEHHNQSLPGLFYRMFTDSPSWSTYDANGTYTPTDFHNVASMPTSVVQILLKAVMGVFAVAVVLTCRARTRPVGTETVEQSRAGWPLAAEFAIILIGMLLFSERTWKHHAVTLVVPFAVLCYALAAVPMDRMLRGGIIASLVVATAGIASTSTGMWNDDFAKLAQVYGGFTLAFVVLTMALVALLAAKPPIRS